jgi:hypothetical protein
MTDITDSTISRRRALQAGVAAGVGAIAWTGPTITSMGGTPAYAAGCTGFTVNEFAENRNTNQGGCANKNFRYQDDSGITLPAGYTWDWTTLECPGNTVNFDYPDGITCSVDIYLYRSTGGAGQYLQYYSLYTYDLPDSGGSFVLPNAEINANSVLVPPPPENVPTNTGGDNFSNTRFAVRVQCIKTSQKDCL